MLVVGEHRFYKEKESGLRIRWHCSMKSKTKCKAFVKTVEDIVADIPVFGKTRTGNPVIMVGTYRFNKVYRSKGPKIRWTCVKTPFGCRAAIYTIDDVIIKTINDHNH
ncbi:hypothetical protein KGM_208244 [Danaus plexippus plexippus]|uniref:FLYWCH-type domain-containing protein n=1 Tax=Danaus plexippus plexippus TaxID=278856 RepID=A0A212FGY4_DANPL|nr:hypothetical protein KGM_208244 [Danaus plexippus plexippus]